LGSMPSPYTAISRSRLDSERYKGASNLVYLSSLSFLSSAQHSHPSSPPQPADSRKQKNKIYKREKRRESGQRASCERERERGGGEKGGSNRCRTLSLFFYPHTHSSQSFFTKKKGKKGEALVFRLRGPQSPSGSSRLVHGLKTIPHD